MHEHFVGSPAGAAAGAAGPAGCLSAGAAASSAAPSCALSSGTCMYTHFGAHPMQEGLARTCQVHAGLQAGRPGTACKCSLCSMLHLSCSFTTAIECQAHLDLQAGSLRMLYSASHTCRRQPMVSRHAAGCKAGEPLPACCPTSRLARAGLACDAGTDQRIML